MVGKLLCVILMLAGVIYIAVSISARDSLGLLLGVVCVIAGFRLLKSDLD